MHKQTIGLQCYITIPLRVTILHGNQIDFNENKDVFKYLNEFPPSDDWLSYEYIDADINIKLNKTKGQLTGYEMENETKHYVEYLNHDANRLNTITIEIDKFLFNYEYINLFVIMYIQWSKDSGSNSSSQTLIIPSLPCFDKLALSQFQVYIETKKMN